MYETFGVTPPGAATTRSPLRDDWTDLMEDARDKFVNVCNDPVPVMNLSSLSII